MNRTLPLAALLILAACGKTAEPAPPIANESSSATASAPAGAPAAKPDVPSLEANWQVTMIGGVDSKALGMTATLGGDRASLSTSCFRRAWTYTQQRNVVDFTASPSGSSNCGGQAPGAQEESAYAALDDANLVIFNNDGKEATLSGTGGTLTLERR